MKSEFRSISNIELLYAMTFGITLGTTSLYLSCSSFFSAAPSLVFDMPAIEMRNKQTMNTVFALSWWSTRCKFDDSLLYGQIIQCILFQFSTPTTIRIRLIISVLFVFFVHSHLFSIWTLNLSESKWDWFDKL